MARVLIIGGHGKVAMRLAPLLVERGDEVTSLIRNPDHAYEVGQTGASPQVADIESLDEAALAEVFRGHDAIVWSAGAGGGDPQRTRAVDLDAAVRSMTAAADAGVSRYVMVSYLGSSRDHGIPEDNSFYAYAEAKSIADEHLRGTDLEWTILAPGPLTLDEPTGLIETADPGDGRVSRADVAAVAAAALADPSTIGRTIAFGNGSVPIAEAIAA
ncbi:SDR family oxidoreductase [Microbacterium sorbitolivorans]|uniref:SDR family NAD(P)-dependent oxidoreductase n=1 Tax=Microbacterium sorbitolivorans TaxID=1867410 RepID=A0A367XU17_9MICO|nr:SDR family oxidoreductase [Microbacterium sorbitolivorans]RCK57115.1 SDR family NAD(P)-dependent oxidoreductase [Microbacterium sorbitolivorans]